MAAPNYDDTIIDWRDRDEVAVDVGAGDSGTEFDPAAVAVSPGTTVTRERTGQSGAQNVE